MTNKYSLIFTNGQEVAVRQRSITTVLGAALNVSPIKGSIAGTKVMQSGKHVATITAGMGWTKAA